MGDRRLRLGVVGLGHHGLRYVSVIRDQPGLTLGGVMDARADWAQAVARDHGAAHFTDAAAMSRAVDAVCVVTPAATHREVAAPFLDAGVPVLLEKPMAATLAEAQDLASRATARGTLLQIGFLERYNPALRWAVNAARRPRALSCARLCPFSLRAADVGIVLDHMIHDIDVVLQFDASEVVAVEAEGQRALSGHEDIAQARLRLASGLVANLTAERVSSQKAGTVGVAHEDGYFAIDCDRYRVDAYRPRRAIAQASCDSTAAPQEIQAARDRAAFELEIIQMDPVNQLALMLEDFTSRVRSGASSIGDALEPGLRTMAVADRILDAIRRSRFSALGEAWPAPRP